MDNIFSSGWMMTDLPPIRNGSDFSTYGRVPLSLLPSMKPMYYSKVTDAVRSSNKSNNCDYIIDFFKDKIEYEIPQFFIDFMNSKFAQLTIRSNTDCYFALGEEIIVLENLSEEGDLKEKLKGCFCIKFLNDSQGCCFWYLLLAPNKTHFVLCTIPFLESIEEQRTELLEETEENVTIFNNAVKDGEIFISAESFEEFIGRFYIENDIWFKLVWFKQTLNESERDYARRQEIYLSKQLPLMITLISARLIPRLGRQSLFRIFPPVLLTSICEMLFPESILGEL